MNGWKMMLAWHYGYSQGNCIAVVKELFWQSYNWVAMSYIVYTMSQATFATHAICPIAFTM
jgi:hypothetical protein